MMLAENVSGAHLYKEMKSIAERVFERPGLMNNIGLVADVSQWDSEVLGLIDQETYTRQTNIAT